MNLVEFIYCFLSHKAKQCLCGALYGFSTSQMPENFQFSACQKSSIFQHYVCSGRLTPSFGKFTIGNLRISTAFFNNLNLIKTFLKIIVFFYGMSYLSIILFFVYTFGLGFTITSFVKNSNNFLERNLMRIGFGLAFLPFLGLILNLIRVPIDWKIMLALSLLYPVYYHLVYSLLMLYL